MRKCYILKSINQAYRRAKVTLLVVVVTFAISPTSRADDLVTLSGKRFKNVRVTEITPATIAFTCSSGAARFAFTEFGPDVQKKYGYDEAKARAWLAQQAQTTAEAERQKQEAAKSNAERYERTKGELQRMRRVLSARYDQATGQWYASEEEAAAAREAALKHAYEAKAVRPK